MDAPVPINDPINAYLDDFRKFRNPAQNTLANRRSTLSRYFKWLQEQGHEWDRVDEDILVGYAGNLKTKGASRRQAWMRLRHFYDWAQRKGFIKTNPATKMYSPPKSAPRAARKGFGKDEVDALLNSLSLLDDVQRFLVTYMLARPVRISELRKLRVCDVNLDQNRIFIGFDPDDPDPAKTQGSCRYQTIPKRSLPILKRLMRGKEGEQSLLAMSRETGRRLIMDIFDKAGVKAEGRGSHAFRHTVIMRLIFQKRIDPAIVAEMAGNSPVTIYRDYLSEVPQGRLEKAMKDAENFR